MPGYKCQARAYAIADNHGECVAIPSKLNCWEWKSKQVKRMNNAIIVQLTGGGEYKITETNSQDEACFIAAANITNWKKLNKIKEKDNE